jgi:hypothetical protein
MRLALIPMYSSPHNIETDSVFNGMKVLVREMVEQFPDLFVYITVPDETSNPAAVEEAFKHERILTVPVPAGKNQNLDLVTLPDVLMKRFAEMGGDLYADVILTGKASLIPYLNQALRTWGKGGTGMMKTAWLNQFFMRRQEHNYLRPEYFRDQVFGLASSDANLWIGEHILKEGLEQAKDYLSFAEVKRLKEKSHLTYWPINVARLDQFQAERDPNEPRVVSFAYALAQAYNPEETLEISDYLFARGNRNIRILVTTPSLIDSRVPERFKQYMEIHKGLPQDQFFKKIATAHAFVILRRDMELQPSVIEQQYLGLVGVFQDRAYMDAHVYKGYPFIGKDKREIQGMLRYVLDNYFTPEIQEVIEKQREFIRQRFGVPAVAKNVGTILNGLVTTNPLGKLGWGVKTMLAETFKNVKVGEILEFDDWCDRLKAGSTMKYDPRDMKPVRYGLSKNRFRRAMLEIGYEDLCDGPVPRFKKVGEWEAGEKPEGVDPDADLLEE